MTITLLTVLIFCIGGLTLAARSGQSAATKLSSAAPAPPSLASEPKFTSTGAWQEMGERIIANKRAMATDPSNMYRGAVNFGFGAFQSKPIDVTGPGEYELQFGPIGDEFGSPPAQPPGFSVDVPPDTTFSRPRPRPKGYITDETGTYYVVAMTVEREGFRGPYPGFRMWMV